MVRLRPMEAIYALCKQLLEEGTQLKDCKFGRRSDIMRFLENAELCKIKDGLDHLKSANLTEMVNAIKRYCTGDGCGLRIGGYVDDMVTELFTHTVPNFEPYHKSDADCKINGIPLSLKTCTNPKGTSFALSWSKNKTIDMSNNFSAHIMVIVAQSGRWWKKAEVVNAGIYLISNTWCKKHITLTKNNKSDKIVSKKEVYKMLRASKHFIPMPEPKGTLKFNILKAFCQESETEHTAQSS